MGFNAPFLGNEKGDTPCFSMSPNGELIFIFLSAWKILKQSARENILGSNGLSSKTAVAHFKTFFLHAPPIYKLIQNPLRSL